MCVCVCVARGSNVCWRRRFDEYSLIHDIQQMEWLGFEPSCSPSRILLCGLHPSSCVSVMAVL